MLRPSAVADWTKLLYVPPDLRCLTAALLPFPSELSNKLSVANWLCGAIIRSEESFTLLSDEVILKGELITTDYC